MAKNWNMANPTPNQILPAYVERGHVQIVFENTSEMVEPSTFTATESEGTNNAQDQPQTDAMAEPAAAMTEVEEGKNNILTPPFREVVTEESPRLCNLANLSKLEDTFDLGYDSDGELGGATKKTGNKNKIKSGGSGRGPRLPQSCCIEHLQC